MTGGLTGVNMKCGVVWCVFIILRFTSHFSKNNPPYCVTVTFIILFLCHQNYSFMSSHCFMSPIIVTARYCSCYLYYMSIDHWWVVTGGWCWPGVVSCNVLQHWGEERGVVKVDPASSLIKWNSPDCLAVVAVVLQLAPHYRATCWTFR